LLEKKKLNVEEKEKDNYLYKNYFYSALKEKSLENYDQATRFFEKCIKLNKNQPQPYYEISQIYFFQSNFIESLKYSKNAYLLNKENKWYALFYAENLFTNKKFDESINVYKDLVKQEPENEKYYIELAICLIYNNELKAAIDTYNSIEELKGINNFTSVQKHKIFLELKDFKSAANELERYLQKNPSDIQTYEMLSDCYILDNNFDKAFEVLKKLTEINPGSGGAHLTLSDFYLQKNNTQEYQKELKIAFRSKKLDAQTKIKKIIPLLTEMFENDTTSTDFVEDLCEILVEVHPEDEMTNYIYADLLKTIKNIDKSIVYYKKVIEINPNQRDAWLDMLFLELQNKSIDSLILDSEKALDFFPMYPTFYYLHALAHFYNKDYLKSIDFIKKGVSFVVDNPTLASEMYSVLGNAYNEIEEYINSDNAYEKSLYFLPENVTVLNNYAYYLSLRGENLDKAKKMSKKTIEMFPTEANYLDTYAWILYKLNKYEEAKQYMLKAIEISESKTFYIHMSKILEKLGDIQESEKYKLKSEELED
tara:strand:+ start:2827 stop:4437 length:1611 start_codon:yes stop_codon:yes gene_type:complete